MVAPVVPGNSAVVKFVTEGRKENNENVVESHCSINNAGVIGSLEVHFKLLGNDDSAFVSIEFFESLSNDSLTSFVGLTTDTNQKFVKIDVTVLGSVKMIEEKLRFFLRD